ncbi:MAG: 2-oxo-4-hydroxy-4-carboxy-5-ureidoimidazoline decarboxylase [Chthoniobacterales bacterium]
MLKLSEINALDDESFTVRLRGLFEHSPWVAARTASQRPFVSPDELLAALCRTVSQAREEEKLALLRAHPDLVGNSLLTNESRTEQKSAGLTNLTPDEIERFREFNQRYREKFGFPFVICARLNKKETILQAFPVRLSNSRQQEIEAALEEIFKIAELRLQDLVIEK